MSDAPTTTDFTLPERCGATLARDLVAAGRAMSEGARLQIDAGAVSRMSCAAVVTVISLAQSAAATGGAVIIRAPTNAFTDAFADLGLFEALIKMEFAE